jgi:hypothetical protein
MCNNAPNNSGEANPKISENQCESVAKEKRNWGGRRKGAGAPRGNLNALKHGRRSRQFAEIGAVLFQSDNLRNALAAMVDRYNRHGQKTDALATEILVGLFKHARDVAAGKDSPGPFQRMQKLNEERKALTVAQSRQRDTALEAEIIRVRQELAQILADNQPPPIKQVSPFPQIQTNPKTT